MALILRKRLDGTVVSEGNLPDVQVLTAKWIRRAAEKEMITFDLQDLIIKTEPPTAYRFVDYRSIPSKRGPKKDLETLIFEKVADG